MLVFLKNLQNQMNQSKKKKEALALKNAIILLNRRQKILNTFESRISQKNKTRKSTYKYFR